MINPTMRKELRTLMYMAVKFGSVVSIMLSECHGSSEPLTKQTLLPRGIFTKKYSGIGIGQGTDGALSAVMRVSLIDARIEVEAENIAKFNCKQFGTSNIIGRRTDRFPHKNLWGRDCQTADSTNP